MTYLIFKFERSYAGARQMVGLLDKFRAPGHGSATGPTDHQFETRQYNAVMATLKEAGLKVTEQAANQFLVEGLRQDGPINPIKSNWMLGVENAASEHGGLLQSLDKLEESERQTMAASLFTD